MRSLGSYREMSLTDNEAETFEKCSILVKVKPPAQRGLRPGGESKDFNHRNILNISRIKIRA